MEEQRVNFETAVLAKEKGFDIETLHFYCKNRTCNYIETPYKYSFEVNANQESLINGEIDNFGYGITWSAPTQSLLQKWLREEHSIDVLVDKGFLSNKYSYEVLYKNDMLDSEYVFKTYEEALEIGLYESLKLI